MLVDPWFVGDLTFAEQVHSPLQPSQPQTLHGRYSTAVKNRVVVTEFSFAVCVVVLQTWLYKGSKKLIGRQVKVDLDQVASETDVLLLTQVGHSLYTVAFEP